MWLEDWDGREGEEQRGIIEGVNFIVESSRDVRGLEERGLTLKAR